VFLRLTQQPRRRRQLLLRCPAGRHHPHRLRRALRQHARLHDPSGAEETQGESRRGPNGLDVESDVDSELHVCFVPAPQNSNYESVQQTARSIAEQAHVLAYDPNYMSPFAQFACYNGLNVRGERLLLLGNNLESEAVLNGRKEDETWRFPRVKC